MNKEVGSRTPGLPGGLLIESDWALTDDQWLKIGATYCPRAELAALVRIAVHAKREKLRVESAPAKDVSFATLAKARERATLAKLAVSELVRTSKLGGSHARLNARSLRVISRIEKATRDYVSRERQERSRVAVESVTDWLAGIGKAASDLIAAYNAPLDAGSRSIARADLDRNLSMRDLSVHPSLDSLPLVPLAAFVDHARDVCMAAQLAASDMSDEQTVIRGSAWNRWIIDLLAICRHADMPIGVKKSGLTASGETSAFVGLVMGLQETFPESLRPHKQTVSATAKAIHEARNSAKKRAETLRRAEEAEIEAIRERARVKHARRHSRRTKS
jgi:hypothetical protein